MRVYYFMKSLLFIYTDSYCCTPTLPQTPHLHHLGASLYLSLCIHVTGSIFVGYLPSRKFENPREHTYIFSLNSALLLPKWLHQSTLSLAMQGVPVSLHPCHYLGMFYSLILANLVGILSPGDCNLYFSDYLDILLTIHESPVNCLYLSFAHIFCCIFWLLFLGAPFIF